MAFYRKINNFHFIGFQHRPKSEVLEVSGSLLVCYRVNGGTSTVFTYYWFDVSNVSTVAYDVVYIKIWSTITIELKRCRNYHTVRHGHKPDSILHIQETEYRLVCFNTLITSVLCIGRSNSLSPTILS